jgi:hypothetical protein
LPIRPGMSARPAITATGWTDTWRRSTLCWRGDA